jgi:hypothetical protein
MLHILPTLTECEILILQTLWNLPHSRLLLSRFLEVYIIAKLKIERDLCVNIEESAWS